MKFAKLGQKLNILLVFKVSLFIFAVSLFFPLSASAANIKTREDIPLDEKLADQSLNQYSAIDKIAVARVSPPSGVQFSDSDEWMKGLYYYSITQLGFVDIPFNYVVTWQGDVYEAKGGGYEALPSISSSSIDGYNSSLLVIYFDNGRDITNSGKDSLTSLLSQLVSIYTLDKSKIYAVDLSYEQTGEDVISSSVVISQASAEWKSVVSDISSGVTKDTVLINTAGKVLDVSYNNTVESGKAFVVTITVENQGDFPWYNSGPRKMYIATSDPRGKNSKFYITDIWDSFTRAGTMNETWVLPGEVATFEIEMMAPLIPGNYSEKFEVLQSPNIWITDSQFEVAFSSEGGDYELLEIQSTETGSLNVRSCPSTGCGQVGQVTPGTIVIKLEQQGNWYKIKVDENLEGWVYGKYVKAV
ncbi:SH3 domain-containing protein [Candidatus Dojkabacteria bacterium]|nr:SH3 domain-containing protein [Candidatus Dojkabacteria bacterium]